MEDEDLKLMKAYKSMYAYIGQLKIREAQMVNMLNTKFKTDIVRKVFYKPTDHTQFVVEFVKKSKDTIYYHISTLDIEEIVNIDNLKDFKKYLENNRIN